MTSGTPSRLWAKDQPLDAAIHAFTVGEDPCLDLELLPFDIQGSAAHARMLGSIGVLRSNEVERLLVELKRLHAAAEARALVIDPALEDGHTLIESELIGVLGDTGARIHTGRSRNDQVTLAQNLWMRDRLAQLRQAQLKLADALLEFAGAHAQQALPGYTHLQRAMPSSFGQWAVAYAEALLEEVAAGDGVRRRLDSCPLGAAAGYGVPLALDRDLVARLLGYRRTHVSPGDAIVGRQRHAQAFVDWCLSCASILERFAWDLVLYSSAEFGFIQLATAFTTGSSIMPQKRNPDVAELLRASCRQLRAHAMELALVGGGLPGGYHRDFQLGKAPLLATGLKLQTLLAIALRVLDAIEIQPAACAAALSPDLHATAAAYAQVRAGVPFRAAYKDVAAQLAEQRFQPVPARASEVSLGAPERLGIGRLRARYARWHARHHAQVAQLDAHLATLWQS